MMASPGRQTDGWALQTFSNKPPKSQPHIFSPCLWIPLLFLLMGLGASEKDSTPPVVKGILGGSVILSLNISVDTEIEHITWSGPQEALALADAKGKIILIDKSYQGRINVTQNNSLSINKLTLKDAGSYKAQINQKNSEVTTSEKFTLSIYDLGASRGRPMGETVAGILGESITLSLALPDSQHIDNVVWMFNTSIISKERGEEATANQLIKFKDPNQSTVWVSSQDYSLKIGQLKMEDAGPYHAYVCSNARVASTKHINLSVYRRLKKPKVTRSLGLTEDGVCRISLTCSVEDSGHNVTYRWSPLQKGAVVSQGGAHLSVSWRSGEKHPSFTCRASNPVSNSSQQFLSRDLCPGCSPVQPDLRALRPERRTALWSGLSLMVPFTLLCFGISGWCFWKKKGRCSAPAFSSSQVEAPADTPEPAADHTVCSMLSQGYEKVDTFPKTARHVSDSSSDSNGTTEEDEERTEMHQPANGRDQVCDLVTQEDAGHDSDSEGQAEYYLVTPDDTTLAFAIEGETVYTQVFLDFQGQTPVPQKKERSATIYCSIQKPQKVVPAPQQNDLESPEISTYENVP
ncbi:T-lymphocyte surface antigen Ly-9 isoform X5 [Neophocaena asiaeorientalis asiaeorientalis]|uniref:T-lymphocyte surface antigen Ly-9 isoform X5 n=1 Tax=Neophocaena asiaeorientalis asiaeorientalis TaxID=1706337 RepID=A0A341CE57_NEOAA|nr:T-lymphocyte surface antigen Ly-9 isoform X5 [Neophocaena asiaeorientalis asiaeorientalis]